MQAFRGVRDVFDLSLDQGQSLLVYGENGTGKSSLADAIEWYFTGEIELLAKEGRDHAVRHLGATMQPLVAIGTNGDLGGACTPKGPNKAAIEAAARETFLLRGRTIADFVDKSKGEKWGALQKLLGLGAIDELRTDLQKARSELKRTRDDAATKLKQAAAALVVRNVEPKKEAIERALADLAIACGFEAQPSIDDYVGLDLKGLIEPPRSSVSGRATAIATLRAELTAAEVEIEVDALRKWNETIDDKTSADASQVDVLSAAARFVIKNPDTKQCPVCDKKIASETLRNRLVKTLADLQEHATRFDAGERSAKATVDALASLHQERTRWRAKARELNVELAAVPSDASGAVKQAVNERRTADVDAVVGFLDLLRAWDEEARTALGSQTAPADEPPQKNHGLELGLLLLPAKQWSDASAVDTRAELAFQRADALFEAYQTEQRKYVQAVLEQISAEVGRLFSRLHPAGNIGSVAVETWADKGIELAVDFYGQRQRPPHGVLSESYMNSVAIVLFLAMARTFNEKLKFLVLDDVVNSFDVTHRGRLGDLLLDEFQDWQLIVLTHDRYFFDQVRRKVKGWSAYQLLGWSYERGPTLREQKGATDIDAALELLEGGHIGDAARRGRRGLEHVLKELCEGLEVPLPYRRGNDNEFREVGTLLNGLRRLLKEDSKGKAFLASIDTTLRALEADAQSVLNVEAHASEAGASSAEVRSTLERVSAFDALWSCAQCNSRVWKEQGVRCKCGATPFPPPAPRA
jgi:energy-coupling factor transporter ATP-binding protein EcfA2